MICAWVARDEPGTVLEMRRDAGKRALFGSAWRHIEPGSQVDTDTWNGYNLLDKAYDHRSVKHSEEYVTEDGVHCNTAEAESSVFKPWWRRFRGVAKRYIHLYLTQYEFARTYRELSSSRRLKMVLGSLYVILERLLSAQCASDSLSHVH